MWRETEMPPPIRLITVPFVFKTKPRAVEVNFPKGDGCLGWLVSLAAIITNCAHSALAVCYTVTMSVALLVTYVLPYG